MVCQPSAECSVESTLTRMSRILLAWELGQGYGHVGRLLPLAAALAERGHVPVFALRDLTVAEPHVARHGFTVLQAPVWLHEVGGLPPPANFAETLLRYGFHEPGALHAMALGWRSLVHGVKPDLIVLDHAPTALLAMRGLGIPRAVFGDGFCVPPDTDPWPAYRAWEKVPQARLADSSLHALKAANAVLDRLGAPRLDRLCDLYAVEARFLVTFPELDHYPGRGDATYSGPIFTAGEGAAPHWPLAGDAKLFAYLVPNSRHFDPVMAALGRCGASVLAFPPGIAPRAARTLSGAAMTVSEAAYDMRRVRLECDVAITHGAGTASAMLLAGKPVLMLPATVEQAMLAKRVEATGAGIAAASEAGAPDYRRLVKRLLTDGALAEAARAFAARHAGYDPAHAIEAIAGRCIDLAAMKRTDS